MLTTAKNTASVADVCDPEVVDAAAEAATSASILSLAEEFDYEIVGDMLDFRATKASTRPNSEHARGMKTTNVTPDGLFRDSISAPGPEETRETDVLCASLHARYEFPGDSSSARTPSGSSSSNESYFTRSAVSGNLSSQDECGILSLQPRTGTEEIESRKRNFLKNFHDQQSFREDYKQHASKITIPVLERQATIRAKATRMAGRTVPVPIPLTLHAAHIALIPILAFLLLLSVMMYHWTYMIQRTPDIIPPVVQEELVPIIGLPTAAQYLVHEHQQPEAILVAQRKDSPGQSQTNYAHDLRAARHSKFWAIWKSLDVAQSSLPKTMLRYLAPFNAVGRTTVETACAWAVEVKGAAERWTWQSVEMMREYYETSTKAAGKFGKWTRRGEWRGMPIARKFGGYVYTNKLAQVLATVPEVAAETAGRAKLWAGAAANAAMVYFEACLDVAGFTANRTGYSRWRGPTVRQKIADYLYAKTEKFANLQSALYQRAEDYCVSAKENFLVWATQAVTDMRMVKRKVSNWRGWECIKQKASSLSRKWQVAKDVTQNPATENVHRNIGAPAVARPTFRDFVWWAEAQTSAVWSNLFRRSRVCQAAPSTLQQLRTFVEGVRAHALILKERAWRTWIQIVGGRDTPPPVTYREPHRENLEGYNEKPSRSTRTHSGKTCKHSGQEKESHRSAGPAFIDTVYAAFAALVEHVF